MEENKVTLDESPTVITNNAEGEAPLTPPMPVLKKEKSVAIMTITQITFKQIFENLLYKDIKEVDGHSVNIKKDIKEYFIYMCKERVEFFTSFEYVLKTIIVNNNVELKDIPLLLNLIITTYNNLKTDSEQIKNSDPKEIMKLLFEILIMLFIDTNDISNDKLQGELMNVIENAIILVSIKPIKSTPLQKVQWMLHK
jgi:hypothetical protein